jgi:hypothetical protein
VVFRLSSNAGCSLLQTKEKCNISCFLRNISNVDVKNINMKKRPGISPTLSSLALWNDLCLGYTERSSFAPRRGSRQSPIALEAEGTAPIRALSVFPYLF